MESINNIPEISWSVWKKSPIVSWCCGGVNFNAVLKRPPLAVADLSLHSLIAIVGSYDEFGSANLLLYSYDGVLKKTLTAPALGTKAHFGRVTQTQNKVSAVVGFFDETGWTEKEGFLNLTDGTIEQLHRAY
jgi:hypothetical protein